MNKAEFKLLRAIRTKKTNDKGTLASFAGISYQTTINILKNIENSEILPYLIKKSNNDYRINPSAKYYIGISVGASHVRTVVLNNCFEVVLNYSIEQAYQRLTSCENKEISQEGLCVDMPVEFTDLASIINQILAELLSIELHYEGIGFAFSGLVKNYDKKIDICYNVNNLDGLPIDKIIKPEVMRIIQENKITICVEHNSKTSAVADKELNEELNDFKDIMCLYLGTGIGAGFIFNNALYRGNQNSSGQVGHIKLSSTIAYESRNGESIEHIASRPINDTDTCQCGGKGCIEQLIRSEVFNCTTLESFKSKLPSINHLEQGQIDLFSSYLAYLVSFLSNSLSFDAIVFSGSLVNFYDQIWQGLVSKLMSQSYASILNNTKLVLSKCGSFSSAIGVAIESHYEHNGIEVAW